MYNKYKKFFWPILAIVLVIILLFCQWEGTETEGTQVGEEIILINTFTGGKDNLQCEGGRDSNSFTPTPTCDGPLYIEIGRWFENVSNSYCEFPNPGAMKWDFYDSTYTLAKWFKTDYSPVNTIVPWDGDRVNGVVWDGATPWRIEVQNNMFCFLNYEYEIRIYETCGTSETTGEVETPGFELALLAVAIILFIGYRKVKKQ